eukprot:880643-Prorocentrum_minimum.AAC.2
MPKSKRNKVMSMTMIRSEGREGKETLVSAIHVSPVLPSDGDNSQTFVYLRALPIREPMVRAALHVKAGWAVVTWVLNFATRLL